MRYSPEFKNSLLMRMLSPNNESPTRLSRETGISLQTLRNWREKALKFKTDIGSADISANTWNSSDKFQIVVETAGMNENDLAEYARKKGVFVEQITAWRDACVNANGGHSQEIARLSKALKEKELECKRQERELSRKDKALAEAAALLVLRKKADAIWGEPKGE